MAGSSVVFTLLFGNRLKSVLKKIENNSQLRSLFVWKTKFPQQQANLIYYTIFAMKNLSLTKNE